MKIRVEHGDFEENELVLRCKELDEEMLELLAVLRERSAKLTGYKDGEAYLVQPGDVLFAEAVDGKTFLYTADTVMESRQSLFALQEAYGEIGLLRISKSQLCNLHHVAKLKSLPNSRIEIALDNGERLIVSRRYIQDLEERLGMAD
ncbi:LytTR family transcriptional regulator DNA-binding domain-containing protein [Ruminococcaceae bacterium OttesenSCG-928-A16]|nr:LytTR family transcriptional regulator DNA-binding domain-containing protein [Ruminococcaceae bacterium OttesenSCG-928-A16]